MTRSEERRKRDRRLVGISVGIAAILHVVVIGFVTWTGPGIELRPGSETVRLEENPWTGTSVDVFFGAPRIYRPDGTIAREAPDRVLEAKRILRMPPACLSRDVVPVAPGSGEVRLTVNARGRIDLVVLTRSTGDLCWDQVATRVAGDLWYRWLPNDGFPAPLELLQPLTVGLALDP